MTIDAKKFSDNMQQIERTVVEMEQGAPNLETALARYQNTRQLIEQCRNYLQETEQKVNWLDPNSDTSVENSDQQPQLASED